MALIKSVRDEEERKRKAQAKAQAQANQSAQTAANKAAQQNSEAAKRNGISVAPKQSAADTIAAAKQKAASGNVTKTPKQYAYPAQYVKKSNPVRRTYNYETLGTKERVDQIASWIPDKKQREQFLKGWEDYTGSKQYKEKQYRKAQLDGMGELYDADGRTINVHAASYGQVVRGIRSIADETKRKEAAAKLEEITKTKGSRFYGQAYDKELTTSYLGNPDFDEARYKKEVSRFENAFYAQSGYDEQNEKTYFELLEGFQRQGYSDSVNRQLKQKLDSMYKDATGKNAPKAEAPAKDKAAEAAADDADDTSWWDEVLGWLGFGDEKREPNRPAAYKDRPELPEDVTETGKTASASVVDMPVVVKPGQQPEAPKEVQGPVQQKQEGYTATQEDMDVPTALQAYLSGVKLNDANMEKIKPYLDNQDVVSGLLLATDKAGVNYLLDRETDDEGRALTREERELNAASETARYGKLGKTMANAAYGLDNGTVPDDMAAIGRTMLADVMLTIDEQVKNGLITVPNGANMYEYALTQSTDLMAQVEQVADLPKQVNAIMTENAVKAKQAEQQALQDAYAASARGDATPEQIEMIAAQDDVRDIDVSDDELRAQYHFQLNPMRSMWYQDDGVFWTGDSIAAQEGQRLLATGSSMVYHEYKDALNREAKDVIDEYTRVALRNNMDLEAYLGQYGMELEDLMNIAYNRMATSGRVMLADPDAPAAIDAMSSGQAATIGDVQAAAMGAAHGVTSYAESFMSTPYQIIDLATYESRREDIMSEYVEQYGTQAPQIYRDALIKYAGSGALDQESSKALLDSVSRAVNIFDVAYDIDPGFLSGLYRDTMEGLGKAVDELEANTQYMSKEGRWWFNAASGLTSNVAGMAVSTGVAIASGGLGLGATAASAIGTTAGFGLTQWDASFKDYRQRGMSDAMAAYMATGQAAVTVAMNMGGTGATADLFGRSSARAGFEAAMRKGGSRAIVEFGKQMIARGAEEAGEEMAESAASYAFSLLDGVAMDIDQGKTVTLSTAMRSVANSFNSTDVKALGKEILTSGLGGFVYGEVFSLGGVALGAVKARKGIKLERTYDSIRLAGEIIRGELNPTEEVLGEFVQALQIDTQDPKFNRYIDSADASARETNNLVIAALTGVGAESRNEALVESRKADDYEKKAEAAALAVAKNQSEYLKARTQALKGDLNAAKLLDGFRIAWAEAGTTLQEVTTAARNCRQNAAKLTSDWLAKSREAGMIMAHEMMRDATSQILAARNAQAEAIVAEEDAEIMAQAEAEAQIEAEPITTEDVPTEQAELDAEREAEPITTEDVPTEQAETSDAQSTKVESIDEAEQAETPDAQSTKAESIDEAEQAERDAEREAIMNEQQAEPIISTEYTDADAPPEDWGADPVTGEVQADAGKARVRSRARAVVQANIANGSSADSAIQVQPHHTPAQIQQINDYHNAVDTRMLKAAQEYKNNPGAEHNRTQVSKVSEREAEDIKKLTGFDVRGYAHTADRNFFAHVEKRHGENGDHDQSMKSLEDVARVGWVIENYDNVELLADENGDVERASGYVDKNGENEPMIRYTKQLDGSVYVVEAVGESKWKKLWLVSAYVQKNSPAQNAEPDGYGKRRVPDKALGTTSETQMPSPVNSRVAQNGSAVKGNVQADYVGMDNVRVQPTKTDGRARHNPILTFNRLAKDLGIGKTFGTRKMNGLEGRAAGYYETNAQYAVSDTRHASSIEVDAHELGHAIAARLNMTGTQQMVNNLTARFPANYTAAQLPGEAFSEFFWRYLVSDQEAENFAGRAYVNTMERNLRREGLLDSVKTAQREVRQFLNASAEEQFRLMTRDKSDTANEDTIGERLMSAERQFISSMVDSTRAAEDVNAAVREQNGGQIDEAHNLRNSALMQGHATKRAATVLNDHLTDVNGTVVGESLKQRLADAGLQGRDFDMFISYMLAKHSIDRDRQNKLVVDRGAISIADTEAFIRDTERNHPEIARAARAFQEFRHDFMMEYMVRTGFMTEKTLNMFEAMYPNYVPTYRVKDRGRRGIGGQTYTIRQATGSTEQIINPMDSFVDMVNTIVAMNLRNETYKTFDRVYNDYEGMGIFGREVTQDRRPDVNFATTQDEVLDILLQANADDDVIRQVLGVIGRPHNTNDVNLPNIIRVQMEDGSTKFYEIFDQALFDMFEGTPDSGAGAAKIIGHLTSFMTAMTTGSNPVFGIRNALRDYQNSVNYGSWAVTYVDGLGKWLNAAWDVFRDGWIGEHTGLNANNATYEQYKALGGGGWTRVDTRTKKGMTAYRGELIEGYNTSGVGRTVKWLGKKLWNGVTLSRLNEIIEQTSRYAEYKYGKHDLSTVEGRREAFLAAQDVTTDFSRRGNNAMARELRAIIPFFNASLQGIYRTGRQFTEGESDRARVRFMKTVINTGLTSALASLVMLKYMDDEDKEEFFYLSDDLKAKHMYLPNFAPDILGESPLIRIPLNQDPLAYAIHAAVTNAVWSGEGEEWAIELGAVADNIMDSLNPVNSTVLDPIIAISTNKNWYGSNIVPRSMEGMYATNQYSAETAQMFIDASHYIEATTGKAISPMMLQYIAEQYTGFVGQMVIPFFSKNEFTGEINGIDAVIEDVRRTLVSDPLKSNDIVSTVYDSDTLLSQVIKAGKKGKPMDMLRGGLSQRDAQDAYDEADEMTHKGGVIYEAKKEITACYEEIDGIEARTDLTDEQKYLLQSEVRRKMIEIALDANEAMAEFREKYIDGERFLTRFMRGTVIRKERDDD